MKTARFQTRYQVHSASAKAFLILLATMAFHLLTPLLQAQPCTGGGGVGGSPITCDVEYKTSLGYGKKCSDFQEFTQSQWPRWQIYLDKTTHGVYRSTSTNEAYGVIGDWAGEYQILSAEFYYTHTTNLDDITLVQRYDRTDCSYTNIYSGFYSALSLDVDNRDMVAPGGSGGCYPLYIYYWRELITDNASPTLCSSGGASNWKRVGTFSQEEDSTETNNCYSGVFQYSTNFVYTNDVSVPGDGIGLNIDSSTPTYRTFSSPDGTITRTEELTNLFSDANLRGLILGQMPAYPGTWYLPDPYFDIIWKRCAYSYIDADHTGRSLYEGAELQKMRFRFVVRGAERGAALQIGWDLITWDVTAGTVKVDHCSTNLPSAGDLGGPIYVDPIEVMPPEWNNSLVEADGLVLTWVDNVNVFAINSRFAAVPGSGPYPAAAAAGCTTCLPNQQTAPAGIAAQFSLGLVITGYNAGTLGVTAEQPSPALATPAGLQIGTHPDVQVMMLSGQLRQVRASQTLVDVITNSAYSYELRYYLPSQFSSVPNGQGFYDPIGSPTPFVTWRIENPDASPSVYNRVRVTETRGADVKVYDYVFTAATGTWKTTYPGNLREDEVSTTITTNATGYTRTVVSTTRVPGGAVQSKSRRVYVNAAGSSHTPAGYNYAAEVLVEETLSPDTDPRTTTYTYYENMASRGTFRPLRKVVYPDGTWRFYEYNYSGFPIVSKVYSGLGDTAPPGSTAPDTSTCRRTEYDYTPLSWEDDGSRLPHAPRTITEYVGTAIVSKRHLLVKPGETRDIRNATTFGAWDDTANLVTITKYYTSGSNTNRIQSIQYPEGRMAFYEYVEAADGSRTNTVSTGEPNAGKTAIVAGTREVTVLGPHGELLSRTVYDIASNPQIVTAQETYDDFDSFNRAHRVRHLDGTTETNQFACCGLESSTDRDGVTTTFGYDALKRQTTATRQNITTATLLDAAGRTLSVTRTAGGTSVVLNRSGFDLAGRLTVETNALDGVTTYTEGISQATGGLARTNLYPDGGTRIETHHRDGSLATITGTATYGVRYEYGVEWDNDLIGNVTYTTETKLKADGTDSGEWTRSYTDFLGRPYMTVYPGNATNRSFYSAQGFLVREVDPDGVTTLYQHNGQGEVEYTAIDLDRDGVIDWDGTDQITRTVSDVVAAHGTNVLRSRTYAWNNNGSAVSNLVSMSEAATTGLESWHTVYRDAATSVQSHTQTAYGVGGTRTVTSTAPDNSYSISLYSTGRLVSVTRYDAQPAQLGKTTYAYDAHGRQDRVTDYRNGTTTVTFNQADLAQTVTTPVPGFGQPPQTTTTYYNGMLQATNVVQPDGASVFSEYHLTGELKKTWGSRTYPVAYGFDYAGRMTNMTTWQNYASSSGAAVARWNFNGQRGWLDNKRYADDQGPSYTYTAAGRLQTRSWARGVTTTYGYNEAGALSTVDYSDSTLGVSYTYDRRGRQSTIVQGGTTTTLAYNLAGEMLCETNNGGTLNGLSVTNGYDSLMRRTTVTALSGTSTVLATAGYGYNAASRLNSVTSGTAAVGYSYLANSPLVSQIAFTNSGTQRMVTTKQHDFLNRLQSIASVPSASSVVSFAYDYNSANQRTLRREADGSYWRYEFDSLGQVKTGKKYWADGTPVAGQQFEYGFDDIGNRKQTKAGGDENGLNLRTNTYGANLLNQYTNRHLQGAVDVMGVAMATNTVTLNTLATYRKGEYFRKELSVANTSVPVWQQVDVAAPNETSVTRHEFVPKTPEAFTYDADGNVSSDGRWTNTWDAENRLVRVVAVTGTGPQQRIDFGYDSQGRRISKKVWNNTSGTGALAADVKFVYDGWNLVAELNATNNAVVRSYVWGLDLSGSIQGAGGVGGLLVVYDTANGTHFPAFDGNGNVVALVNLADGSGSAQYQYGPFGEILRRTGPMAASNPFGWSTRYLDDETGLVAYPRRTYSSSTGRWLSRDPGQEKGGRNLYAFARNGMGIDPLGLVELHYIDHPKWSIIDFWGDPHLKEYLWVGHYLTFNQSDAERLSGNRGVLMVKHRSVAYITDCATDRRVTAVSHNWYFANKFILSSGGRLQSASDTEPFDDQEFHLFTQIANASFSGMWRKYSGETDSGERLTKGRFHSEMELRIIPLNRFDEQGWDTSPTPGYRQDDINGHELGRTYWGRAQDITPASWSAQTIAPPIPITLDFEWNDCAISCGGRVSWNYKISPWLTERGAQRTGLSHFRHFDFWVDLVLNPHM